ncbi:MAG: hypothetical protein ABIQ64_00985 [Candidatus Saccharimonadales bacterium]
MKQLFNKGLLALAIVPMLALGVSVVSGDVASAQDLTIRGGADAAASDEQSANLFTDGGIFEKVTTILLFLIGAISVIMLIIGGIRYVVSGGDQAAVTSAKNTILYAIVGIVVAFLAYAAVTFVIDSLVSAT